MDSYWYFADGTHGSSGEFRLLTDAQAVTDALVVVLAIGQPLPYPDNHPLYVAP